MGSAEMAAPTRVRRHFLYIYAAGILNSISKPVLRLLGIPEASRLRRGLDPFLERLRSRPRVFETFVRGRSTRQRAAATGQRRQAAC